MIDTTWWKRIIMFVSLCEIVVYILPVVNRYSFVKKVKGTFLFPVSSIRYPVIRTVQNALPFTPDRPVHVIATSVKLQFLREDYSFRYPPLFVARYSFIQM